MVPVVDYFFGAYTTPQQQRLRMVARNGVAHASEIDPHDPPPGQPVSLMIISDAVLPIDHIAVYFTTDGADPLVARIDAEVARVSARLEGERERWAA